MTVIVASDEFLQRSIDALYTEALLLSDETRGYFEGEGKVERDGLDPFGRVQFACEALKATTRMLQVIAWLAASRFPGVPVRPLAAAGGSTTDVLGSLPSAARRLILAGIDLHERTGRLAEGSDAPIALQSPARALIQRLERSL